MKKALLILAIAFLQLHFGHCYLKTNKWDKQKQKNAEFCGSEAYLVKTNTKYCQSFWLAPVRYDQAIISAAKACAVCSAGGVGTCVTCSGGALKTWFVEMAVKQGQALQRMGRQIQGDASEWLVSHWNSVLSGRHVSTIINGWKVSARGGLKNFCSSECTRGPFGNEHCLPRTCLQDQPYIQIKVEQVGGGIGSGSGGGGSSGSQRECHKMINSCNTDAWTMFGYRDSAKGRWVGRGWYKISANSQRELCYNRGTHLYMYWNFAGTTYSTQSDARFSVGKDATFCGCVAKQKVFENYKGYNYYDEYTGKGSSTCYGLGLSSCSLRTFEHIDDGNYGSSHVSKSCPSSRRLGAASSGAGGLELSGAVNMTSIPSAALLDAIILDDDNDVESEKPPFAA